MIAKITIKNLTKSHAVIVYNGLTAFLEATNYQMEDNIDNTDTHFKVLCIDGMVDGVIEGKVYNVVSEFIREDGIFYGVEKDDYEIYNEFRAERFFKIDKIKNEILKNILNS
jgi:hypothetical protein